MRSSSFCNLRKRGEALRMINSATTVMTASTAKRISPIIQSFIKARMREMAKTMGTGSTICMLAMSANWMFVTSETVRVVIEATPKARKSDTARSSVFL